MTVHQTALDKAKIQLMSRKDSAFFTTVCFSMKHIWDEGIPTACTNGLEIRFSPAFFMSLDAEEQLFLILHETLHVALMHVTRLNGRDPRKWNYAADYVINLMLVDRGFKMPEGGLLDRKYADMTADEVYKLLPDIPAESLPMEDIKAAEGDGVEEIQSKLDDILVRATLQSQMADDKPGTIPGEVQLYVDRLLNPKLPWNRILQRFITKLAKNDYTFRKPNRRYFPEHYLPTRYSENLCDIAVAIDTSGSVTDKEFQQFASEVYAILKNEKPTSLTLLRFDTAIRGNDTIVSAKDLMQVKFTGRGGTRIEPVIQWATETRPHVLLIFTDGGFHNLAPNPNLPIVWVINDNPNWTAPWGKVIHFNTK